MTVGISWFDGQSREPVLRPAPGNDGGFVLQPHYEKIRQFGLDAQLTTGLWLLELEGTAFHGVRWPGDVLYGVRRDSFIGLSLVYSL